MNTMIIGIAGGTGSGKTTLTDHLAAHFGSASASYTTIITISARMSPLRSAASRITTIPMPLIPASWSASSRS